MSEHNFLADIFTAIFLQLFLMIILGLLAGVKMDTILTGYFRLLLSIIGSCLEITAKLTAAFVRELLKAIAQQRAIKSQEEFNRTLNQGEARPEVKPVKVVVVED